MSTDLESERVRDLLGAHDLIRECEEMLRGEREELTSMEDYLRQRLAFWQGRFASLDRRRADRRRGERRHPDRAMFGRRSGGDRRHGR
jgi:hypothetical protein